MPTTATPGSDHQVRRDAPTSQVCMVEENARLRLELGRERGSRADDSTYQSQLRAGLFAELEDARRDHRQARDELAACRRRVLVLEGQRVILGGLLGLGGLAMLFKRR